MIDGMYPELLIQPVAIKEDKDNKVTTVIGADGKEIPITKRGARSSLYLYLRSKHKLPRPQIWALDPKKRAKVMNAALKMFSEDGKPREFKFLLDGANNVDAVVTSKHKQIPYSSIQEAVEKAIKNVVPDAKFTDRGLDRYWTYSLPINSKYVQSHVGIDAGVNKPKGRCAVYIYTRMEVTWAGQEGTQKPCHKSINKFIPQTLYNKVYVKNRYTLVHRRFYGWRRFDKCSYQTEKEQQTCIQSISSCRIEYRSRCNHYITRTLTSCGWLHQIQNMVEEKEGRETQRCVVFRTLWSKRQLFEIPQNDRTSLDPQENDCTVCNRILGVETWKIVNRQTKKWIYPKRNRLDPVHQKTYNEKECKEILGRKTKLIIEWNWAFWERPGKFFNIDVNNFGLPKEYERLNNLSTKAVHVHGTKVSSEDIETAIKSIMEAGEIIDPIIEDAMNVDLHQTEIEAIIDAYKETVGLPDYAIDAIKSRVIDADLWGLSNAVSWFRTHGELRTSKTENREARGIIFTLENIAGELLTLGPAIREIKKRIPDGRITKDILLNPKEGMFDKKVADDLKKATKKAKGTGSKIVETGEDVFA